MSSRRPVGGSAPRAAPGPVSITASDDHEVVAVGGSPGEGQRSHVGRGLSEDLRLIGGSVARAVCHSRRVRPAGGRCRAGWRAGGGAAVLAAGGLAEFGVLATASRSGTGTGAADAA